MIRILRMFPDHPELERDRRRVNIVVVLALVAATVAVMLGIAKAVS